MRTTFFSGFQPTPGVTQNCEKKLEFSHFYPILIVFEPFDPIKHEKSTKTKVFLKIWLELLTIITTTPEGNS
jgi:hypothetical protein